MAIIVECDDCGGQERVTRDLPWDAIVPSHEGSVRVNRYRCKDCNDALEKAKEIVLAERHKLKIASK